MRFLICFFTRSLAITILLLGLALPQAAVAGSQKGSIVGADRDRPRIEVRIEKLTAGGKAIDAGRPTDLGYLPLAGPQVLLTSKHKSGELIAWNLESGESKVVLTVPDVATQGMEQGIVSFAFHPSFADDRRLFTMHDAKGDDGYVSHLTQWTVDGSGFADLAARDPEVILAVPQPQAGHNAGAVRFGPDGMLYQAFGDGGFQRDPDHRGQDTTELHSTIVRIDVNSRSEGLGYSIPEDNPFVGKEGFRPEIWAYGFRNPYRFTWAPDGRLVEADVGQEAFEEINIVEPGRNYGWGVREGADCFSVTRKRRKECEAACAEGTATYTEPIHHYPRTEGMAIIGGKVATGSAVPELAGKYVFADHVGKKLWAMDLPDPSVPLTVGCGDATPPKAVVYALGKFGVVFISFGITPDGDLIVGAFDGSIWKIVK